MSLISEIKTLSRIQGKRVIPTETLNSMRAKRQKSARIVAANSNRGLKKFSAAHLHKHLESSGIDPARDIFIHASFSKIGADCKAEELLEAIIGYMKPTANILMPAYPMPGTMLEWMSNPAPFDVQTNPSMMGILSEVFRKRPGTWRSLHPTHSVCALGPDGEYYVKDHHKSLLPCSEVSPFARLVERDGQILCIGSDVGKITAYHLAEDLNKDFPFNVHLPRPMTKTVIHEGREIAVEVMIADPALSPWRVDNYDPKEEEFKRYLKQYGCLTTGRIGNARLDIIDARRFVDMLNKLAKKGITIYHRPENYIVRKIAGFPF